jgi:sialic acid synthase SpsE
MKNKIKNIFSKKNNSTYVIAEMAWSHDGLLKNAKKIVDGASRAGANAIGVHITDMPSYMVKNYGQKTEKISFAWKTKEKEKENVSIYDYLERLNLKEGDWEEIFLLAKNSGLEVCAMPNDSTSLKLCRRLKPAAYIIGAACFLDDDFAKEIAREKKPILLRIGGATLAEIKKLTDIIKREGNSQIILLHGVQLYPTQISDMNLKLIPFLGEKFHLPIGLADHIDGASETAYILPLLALPLNAKVIEKHLTYDRDIKGEDFESAFDPDGFKKFVGYIKNAEKSLGFSSFPIKLSKTEVKYREISRKRVVAAKNIKKGEKITKEKIILKRATEGIFPDQNLEIIGKKAVIDIEEDSPILLKYLSK